MTATYLPENGGIEMIFLEAFLWGTGLSLGMCVGLVAWVFLRTAVNKLLGITEQLNKHVEIGVNSLLALQERNDLTISSNARLERIANAVELKK
jgi:hypothetical protein